MHSPGGPCSPAACVAVGSGARTVDVYQVSGGWLRTRGCVCHIINPKLAAVAARWYGSGSLVRQMPPRTRLTCRVAPGA